MRLSTLPAFAVSIALLAPASAWAISSGPPAGLAGAPGEGNCTACHAGTANSGAGRVRITLPAGATTYLPGQSIRVKVEVEDPTARRWGFQLTSRLTNSTGTQAGTFSLSSSDGNAQLVGGGGQPQAVTHTSAGTRRGTAGSAEWEMDWTPPAGGGSVTFYAAGNAANNNGSNTGDNIYTTSLTITPASVDETRSGNRVLSQFTFGPQAGGRWASQIYFTNNGDTPVTFPVYFSGTDGNRTGVPDAQGNLQITHNVTIAPRGVAVIEAGENLPFAEASALIDLPAAVQGYGVFRFALPGRAAQEAVVPLANATARNVVLVFDDTAGLRTAAGVANPSDASVRVTMTARDSAGAVIGTATRDIPAYGKIAVILNEVTELQGMAGKRGTVEFSTPTGAVAVLGLRAADTGALTSIPAFER